MVRRLPPPLRKRRKKARKHEKKLVERIERYVAKGKTKKAAELARLYGKSNDAKIVALFDAIRSYRRA